MLFSKVLLPVREFLGDFKLYELQRLLTIQKKKPKSTAKKTESFGPNCITLLNIGRHEFDLIVVVTL